MIGPQLSVISGGLLCIAGVAVVARLFPELAAHVVRPPVAPGAASDQGGVAENSKSKIRSPGS